jgi:hypothetical protein
MPLHVNFTHNGSNMPLQWTFADLPDFMEWMARYEGHIAVTAIKETIAISPQVESKEWPDATVVSDLTPIMAGLELPPRGEGITES